MCVWGGGGLEPDKLVIIEINISMLPFFYKLLSPRFFLKRWGYFYHLHPSVRPSICLSVARYLLLNHWGNSTKLAISLTFMVKVCESDIIFLCVRPCVCRLSVVLSPPKNWVDFNLNFYITSLHGKVVREQNSFSMRPSVCVSVIRPSVRHAISS